MVGFLLALALVVFFCGGVCAGWMARRYLEVRARHYYRRGYTTRDPQRTALAIEPEPVVVADAVVDQGTRDIFAGMSMNGHHD